MMIGGSPMMMQPQFAPQPVQIYQPPRQGQAQVAQPQPWPPQQAQPRQQPQPQFQPPPLAAQQPTGPPIVRGIRPDEVPAQAYVPVVESVKMAPVRLPSPEELGVGLKAPAPAASVDWNTAHARLQQLGGIGLQSTHLPDGRVRVAFLLRTNQVNQVHHVEATASTEAEAVAVALSEAEKWASPKP
ncbi:MAG TPA: hypothetical protein VE988_01190 [Gemmataceae bacterium]|nr:hypothetical protein [Gemmataceae bacterium]